MLLRVLAVFCDYSVCGGELCFLQTLSGLIATIIEAIDDVSDDGLPGRDRYPPV